MKFTCNNLGQCYKEKPGGHCWDCSHACFEGQAKGRGRKLWRFEFNPCRGFLFLNKDDSTSKIDPAEKNPIWKKLAAFVRKINKERNSMITMITKCTLMSKIQTCESFLSRYKQKISALPYEEKIGEDETIKVISKLAATIKRKGK